MAHQLLLHGATFGPIMIFIFAFFGFRGKSASGMNRRTNGTTGKTRNAAYLDGRIIKLYERNYVFVFCALVTGYF